MYQKKQNKARRDSDVVDSIYIYIYYIYIIFDVLTKSIVIFLNIYKKRDIVVFVSSIVVRS